LEIRIKVNNNFVEKIWKMYMVRKMQTFTMLQREANNGVEVANAKVK
jgi:hypothetical protein